MWCDGYLNMLFEFNAFLPDSFFFLELLLPAVFQLFLLQHLSIEFKAVSFHLVEVRHP